MEQAGQEINTLVANLNTAVEQGLETTRGNDYLSAAVSLFLILYAGYAAPRLPDSIIRLFGNNWFKLLLFFLIAYSAGGNPTVAIIASVALMVSLMVLTNRRVDQKMMELVDRAAKNKMIHPAVLAASRGAHDLGRYGRDIEGDFKRGVHDVEGEFKRGVHDIRGNTEALGSNVAASLGRTVEGLSSNADVDFRDSFYPQYVNMQPDSYMARHAGDNVKGFPSEYNYRQEPRDDDRYYDFPEIQGFP